MFTERRGAAALLALTAALSLVGSPVYADEHKNRSNGQSLVAEISPDRAASIARSATGGRVLKVERQGNVYRVRVLLDGERVRNVTVDAVTGKIRN